jgi:alpha-galactosidase
VNEELIRATADAMATNGMKDAGYQYINLDDCWQGQRDAL